MFNSPTDIQSSKSPANIQSKIGVYYYVWYGKNGRHWNDAKCNTVVDRPLLGYYDSRDTKVIRQHIKWLTEAGIDFLVISWWGKGSYEDGSAKKVIAILNEMGNPLEFCLIVERNRYLDFNYLRKFFENDAYLKLDGKPVLVTFESHPNTPGYYWINYLENSDEISHIMPGYDESHLGRRNPMKILRKNGECYISQWTNVQRTKTRLILIVSWNEFHERTQIEPCSNWEEPFLYLEITASKAMAY
jgi:hypothetical protein